MTRILLAADGSESALRAAQAAAELARQSGAEVLVLHVLPPPPAVAEAADRAGIAGWGGSLAALRGFKQAGEDSLARAAEVLAAVGVRHLLRLEHGHPADRICEVAREEQCDLIVVGRHGVDMAAALPIGGVAERVALGAPCTVMIVR